VWPVGFDEQGRESKAVGFDEQGRESKAEDFDEQGRESKAEDFDEQGRESKAVDFDKQVHIRKGKRSHAKTGVYTHCPATRMLQGSRSLTDWVI